LLIATHSCCFKCLKEQNLDLSICQNSHLNLSCTNEILIKDLIAKYTNNVLSECVVFAGLEPILQFDEILNFIKEFRKIYTDDIVIYTGYYEYEIQNEVNMLKDFENIIIKFGRFVPNKPSIYDNILKIKLVSDNQYAKRIEDL